MKRSIIIAVALMCLLVPTAAFAGDDATQQATPTTDPTDTSTAATTSTDTSSTSTETTATTTPPPTTTTTTTTDTPTTTTTTTVPDGIGTGTSVDLLPADEPCDGVVGAVACGSDNALPVAGEGVGPSPVVGGSGALPFTGIEDALLPALIGLVALLGGVIAYRYATVKERLSRVLRVAQERAARRRINGYTNALRNFDADNRTAMFWTGGGPPACAA